MNFVANYHSIKNPIAGDIKNLNFDAKSLKRLATRSYTNHEFHWLMAFQSLQINARTFLVSKVANIPKGDFFVRGMRQADSKARVRWHEPEH